jgi:DNA-binding transcriptional ArsR family regulator
LDAILRNLAVINQKEQPQAFYSVREIATRFGVPISAVSNSYRRLENEGLVSRVRSSRTILQGLTYDRRLSVRAFVGLPALLPAFLTIQDYRTFFISIRRELRLRGFATAMAFYKPNEAQTHALSDRLQRYEVDTVIWFLPPKIAREAMLRLSDRGIRLLGVCETESSVIPRRYLVRRQKATEALLNHWKRKGIREITVVKSPEHRSPFNEQLVEAAAKKLRITCEVVNFRTQRTESFLQGLAIGNTGGIVFPSGSLASMFCFRRPKAVTELIRQQRVALIDGPVNMPFTKVPDVRVDLITVDWQLVAEAIVNDLITQEAFQRACSTTFEAQPHFRVPFNQFAESI